MTASRGRSVGLGLLIIIVNVLIVALVAVSVSQRGISGWWATLRGEWVPLEDALDADDPLADDALTTTAAPDDDALTTTPPAVTEAPSEEPAPPTAAELYAEGEDVTVLVLGDLTGVHENDWPAAWGRMLSSERAVHIYSPLESDPTQYGQPLDLGEGQASVSLYNASYVDGTPAYAAERLPLLAAEEPDVILLSYGRSNTPEDLPPELDALWEAIAETFPEVESYVVVAPPRVDGPEPTTEATREWAQEADAPVIDVARVFEDEGIVRSTQSGRDPRAVNIPGNERWAQIVHRTVLGTELEAPQADAAPAPTEEPAAGDPAPPVAEPVPPVEPTYIAPPYVPPYIPPYQPPVLPPALTPAPTPAPTEPEPTAPEPTDPAPTDPLPTDPPSTGEPPTEPPAQDAAALFRLLASLGA